MAGQLYGAGGGNVGSGGPDILDVIQDLESAGRLVMGRLNPKMNPEESEVFAMAALLIMLSENILMLAQNGINPFAMVPSGAAHFDQLKADFNAYVSKMHNVLSSESMRRDSENPSTSATRPGCLLQQPVTLTCPHCAASISADIGARVSSEASGNLTGNKKLKVRLLQGQQTNGALNCPNCQRTSKMKLILTADEKTSNVVNIQILLEKETPCVGETRRMISDATQLLSIAADNIIEISQKQRQPSVDNQTVELVVKSIEVAFSILLAVRDDIFRFSPWMTPGENGISVFEQVGEFLREHVPLIQIIPSNAP